MVAVIYLTLVFADGRLSVDGMECGAETAALYPLAPGRVVETLASRAEYRLDERGSVLRLSPGTRLQVSEDGVFKLDGGAAVIQVRGRRRYTAGCVGGARKRLKKGVHRLNCGSESAAEFWRWSEARGDASFSRQGGGWSWFGLGGGGRGAARTQPASPRRGKEDPSEPSPPIEPDPPNPDQPKKALPKGCRVVSRRALRRARRRVGEMRVVDLACRCKEGGDCRAP